MKYKNFFLITLLILIVVAAPVTIYLYLSRNSTATKNITLITLTDNQILNENTNSSKAFVSNTSQENVKLYLEKLFLL